VCGVRSRADHAQAARLKRERRRQIAEQLTVRLNGGEQTIAEKAAAGLFVRPASSH